MHGLSDMGSNPSVGQKFSFSNFRLLRVTLSSTGPIQIKSSMTFIRGKRFIRGNNVLINILT